MPQIDPQSPWTLPLEIDAAPNAVLHLRTVTGRDFVRLMQGRQGLSDSTRRVDDRYVLDAIDLIRPLIVNAEGLVDRATGEPMEYAGAESLLDALTPGEILDLVVRIPGASMLQDAEARDSRRQSRSEPAGSATAAATDDASASRPTSSPPSSCAHSVTAEGAEYVLVTGGSD
jgi:hypothetical protein